MVNFSEAEFLREWKLRLGLLGQAEGCEIERHDMSETDERVKSWMRSWYAGLLHTADPRFLPQRDLAGEVQKAVIEDDGALRITVPPGGCRPLEVKLRGWKHAVRVFHKPCSRFAARQRDTLLRCTPQNPGAVALPDAILAYCPCETGENAAGCIERLVMTAWPADGSYTMNVKLLNDIK